MTVLEENGILDIIVESNGKKRRESVTGIKPTVTDADLYEIATSIANLLAEPVALIRRRISKSYTA